MPESVSTGRGPIKPVHFNIADQVNDPIQQLRESTPLPVLLRKLKLGRHARPSCTSPLRDDHSASWGIYPKNNRWYWKDLGTGDGGDEIEFLARLHKVDSKQNFAALLDRWEMISMLPDPNPQAGKLAPAKAHPTRPDCQSIREGKAAELQQLCQLRGFDLPATEWAQQRGILRFGSFLGHACYGVTDQDRRLLEWRRLDGQLFPAIGELAERKSHTVRGSNKSWPVGIQEANDAQGILLVEGLPDLLAAHTVIGREGKQDTWAPVGLMGATANIEPEALDLFRGKRVKLVPHLDAAGKKAAQERQEALKGIASKVDFFLVDDLNKDPHLKDLCDYLPTHVQELAAGKEVLS
jgi:hypothetical protein